MPYQQCRAAKLLSLSAATIQNFELMITGTCHFPHIVQFPIQVLIEEPPPGFEREGSWLKASATQRGLCSIHTKNSKSSKFKVFSILCSAFFPTIYIYRTLLQRLSSYEYFAYYKLAEERIYSRLMKSLL